MTPPVKATETNPRYGAIQGPGSNRLINFVHSPDYNKFLLPHQLSQGRSRIFALFPLPSKVETVPVIKNIIFDWSGTLADDFQPVLQATNDLFAEYGKPPFSEQDFREKFFLPFPEFYQIHLPEATMANARSTSPFESRGISVVSLLVMVNWDPQNVGW